MKKKLVVLILSLISMPVFAGTSPIQEVDGIITKIEGNRVTVVSSGKDVVVEKKFIPKDKLKVGNRVAIAIESPKKK